MSELSRIFSCVGLVVVLLVGCSKTPIKASPEILVQVTGKVTNGKMPMDRIIIMFVPVEKSSRARGMTNASGEYKLMDETKFPGVAPGEYMVIFRVAGLGSGPQASSDLFKTIQDPETTPFRANVTSSTTEINFDLSHTP